MGDIVRFTGLSCLPVPPGKVLRAATEAGLTEVVVMGYDADGDEYFASSESDKASVMWLLERMRTVLMETPETTGKRGV